VTCFRADKVNAGKNTKYREKAHQNGLSFLPVIFESTGRMHPDAIKMFKSFAKLAEIPLKIPKATLYGFFIKRLSCTLQRAIANTILSRTTTIRGRLSKAVRCSRALSYDAVSSHNRIRGVGKYGLRDF
jgi:hypothetical protein